MTLVILILKNIMKLILMMSLIKIYGLEKIETLIRINNEIKSFKYLNNFGDISFSHMVDKNIRIFFGD